VHLSTTIPALPVESVVRAAEFYTGRFGFGVRHLDPDGFAVVVRDDAEIHLWQADDDRWRGRADLAARPVRSGAETFLAGTASCRVHVDDVEALHAELGVTGVLHPTDPGSPVDTGFGTREFAALDGDGNLLTFFRRRAT
jgi:catechol 2,3-dioxygenase-like lactoylglutathione lyase family enzyme